MKLRFDILIGIGLLVTSVAASSVLPELWNMNILVALVVGASILMTLVCGGFMIVSEEQSG